MADEALAGRLTEGGHVLPVRVYWEDTDAGGIVYHAAYLRFMERGRTDCLRLAGVDQGRLIAETGLRVVVVRMAIDFRGSGRLDDVLEVVTRYGPLRGARIGLHQEVRLGGSALVAAEITCAMLGNDGRPRRLPAAVLAALTPDRPGGERE